MYLKKENGPRLVTLPDGSTLTRSDLPDPSTSRWVARRKALVVQAVGAGLLQFEEACEIYNLSHEELESWQKAIKDHGIKALRATAVQDYRQGSEKNDTNIGR